MRASACSCSAAALLVAAIVPELMRLVRTRRWLARLPRSGQRLGPDVEVVESATPFAFAAGLLRPRILLAARLVEACRDRSSRPWSSTSGRTRGGAIRSRGSRRACCRSPIFRACGARCSQELAIASEQACDAEAGRRIGDRLAVAEAILAVERILSASAPAPAGLTGFEGNSVAERVRALLAVEPSVPAQERLPDRRRARARRRARLRRSAASRDRAPPRARVPPVSSARELRSIVGFESPA